MTFIDLTKLRSFMPAPKDSRRPPYLSIIIAIIFTLILVLHFTLSAAPKAKLADWVDDIDDLPDLSMEADVSAGLFGLSPKLKNVRITAERTDLRNPGPVLLEIDKISFLDARLEEEDIFAQHIRLSNITQSNLERSGQEQNHIDIEKIDIISPDMDIFINILAHAGQIDFAEISKLGEIRIGHYSNNNGAGEEISQIKEMSFTPSDNRDNIAEFHLKEMQYHIDEYEISYDSLFIENIISESQFRDFMPSNIQQNYLLSLWENRNAPAFRLDDFEIRTEGKEILGINQIRLNTETENRSFKMENLEFQREKIEDFQRIFIPLFSYDLFGIIDFLPTNFTFSGDLSPYLQDEEIDEIDFNLSYNLESDISEDTAEFVARVEFEDIYDYRLKLNLGDLPETDFLAAHIEQAELRNADFRLRHNGAITSIITQNADAVNMNRTDFITQKLGYITNNELQEKLSEWLLDSGRLRIRLAPQNDITPEEIRQIINRGTANNRQNMFDNLHLEVN